MSLRKIYRHLSEEKRAAIMALPDKASLARISRGTAESLRRLFPENSPDSFQKASL